MTLLVLETSTRHGSVALLRDGEEVMATVLFRAGRSHNACLFPVLRDVLAEADRHGGIGHVLAGQGPGSYTGVRIGIAAAQAVALSRGVEVTGMSSLLGAEEADARQGYTVAGDARRGSLYLARVSGDRLREEITVAPAAEVRRRIAGLLLREEIVLSFDGVSPAEGITLGRPHALRLGEVWFRRRTAAKNRDCAEEPGLPLEPIYLAAPFITQPKKLDRILGKGARKEK